MSDIEKAIELLKTINQNMKAEHMAKDMCHGVTKEEISDYRKEFKLINVAVSELEKQIPKKVIKPVGIGKYYHQEECPNCKNEFRTHICGYRYTEAIGKTNYCPNCGIKIDWSVEK